MAENAEARETIFALRRQIAKIEGNLPDTLDPKESSDGSVILRRRGLPISPAMATGSSQLDFVLGSSLSEGLIEIHGDATRDAGAVSGFTLALASIVLRNTSRPLLWVGTSEIFREAGRPYAPGIMERFGISHGQLLIAEAEKPSDVLWIAEEAANLTALSAVLLETRGSPRLLDLTATRRLHRRAIGAAHPIVLMRQTGAPEPTAAPTRLKVTPAVAGQRQTIAGPLQNSIGPPAFTIHASKSRTSPPTEFTLEWNAVFRAFEERGHDLAANHIPENPRTVVSSLADRENFSSPARAALAFSSHLQVSAFGDQSSGGEQPTHLLPRRAG